jgi:hypothetical protein
MFPIEIYITIIAIDGLLTLYAVSVRNTDEWWINTVAYIMSAFFSVYLALVSVSGSAVQSGVPLEDAGLMWIFIIVAVIQGILAVVDLLGAHEDYVDEKHEKERMI